MLNEILRSTRDKGTTMQKPPDMPDFPLTDMLEFEAFDKRIETETVVRNYMVSC